MITTANLLSCLRNNADQATLTIIQSAQSRIEKCWEYAKRPCPDLKEMMLNKVLNYSQNELEFGTLSNASNRTKALPAEDYVLLWEGKCGPVRSVNRSRKNGFSYNWCSVMLVCYIPALDYIWVNSYINWM